MFDILENKVFIYGLVDPRDNIIKYIGKTNKPNYRLSQHCREKDNNKKCNWIKRLKKIGLKPRLEIIDEVLVENWQQAEIAYIRLFKSYGARLLNQKDGGYGGNNLSVEARKKISSKQKKKVVYQYDLQGIFINEYESISDASRKTGISVPSITTNCSGRLKRIGDYIFKYKKEVSNKFICEPYNHDYRCKKSVLQYDFDGNFIKEYKSAAEAARETNSSTIRITNCCNGLSEFSNGFMFKYKKDYQDGDKIDSVKKIRTNKLSKNSRITIDKYNESIFKIEEHIKCFKIEYKKIGKPIAQYDINGDFLKHFDNLLIASKELGIKYIQANKEGEYKFCQGYIFKYIKY